MPADPLAHAPAQALERIAALDARALADEIDRHGAARIPRLLPAAACAPLRRAFRDDDRFRATIDMARHRFGEGTYRYFASPLPGLVEELRRALYPPLARVANAWEARRGREGRFPRTLPAFLARCADAGQQRPTPLLLRYEAGGYNCLHQDRYGEVAFPLQVVVQLARQGVDFEGGELLLVEQRPRMQSVGRAFALERGEALVFPNADRPVAGARGAYRVQVRHGVSELRLGERMTLGLIFHDAT